MDLNDDSNDEPPAFDFSNLPDELTSMIFSKAPAKSIKNFTGASKKSRDLIKPDPENPKTGIMQKALERTCLAAIKEPQGEDEIVFSNGVCADGWNFRDMLITTKRAKQAVEFNRKCREESSVCTKVVKKRDNSDDDSDDDMSDDDDSDNEEDTEKVNIPKGTIMIGSSAFESHRSIKEINIPNTVTNIGSSAFKFCMNLERVSLPESVKIIQPAAFAYCNKLEEIIMPKGIAHIGAYAFKGCNKLNLIFQNDVPYLSRDNRASFGPSEVKQITFRINFKKQPRFQVPFGTDALPGHNSNISNLMREKPKIVIESVN